MPENYWHLSKCHLFNQMQPEDIRTLAATSRVESFKRGDSIYLPQDRANEVLLLVSGRIKICHLTPEGKQSILVFIEPGEVFGELCLFDYDFREEYAEATENSRVIFLPRKFLSEYMDSHSHMMRAFSKLLGERRLRIEKRLRNLLFHSNRERLIFLLIELLEQYGQEADGAVELKIKLSHQEMANIIGSTRETVTVVLGELQKEGILEIARRRVKILQLDLLASQVHTSRICLPENKSMPLASQSPVSVSY